jgi:hypothetical protein
MIDEKAWADFTRHHRIAPRLRRHPYGLWLAAGLGLALWFGMAIRLGIYIVS